MQEFPAEPPYASSKRLTRLLLVLAALCAGLVAPYLAEKVQYSITRGKLRAQSEAAAEELAKLDKNAELVALSDTSRAFRNVARRIEPSVVHIDVVHNVDNPSADGEVPFRLPFEQPRWQARGEGSGVVVDAQEGYVLTNRHVVEAADSIEVKLSDGRTIDRARVELVGDDDLTDLALLRLDAPGLIEAVWGKSEDLEVGDWVLAVGNPYGLDRTVTSGIVSAKNRRGVSETRSVYQNFLQTDAAVNPGNSGGPLLNIRGEVVGITTAIVGGAYQGISFAIPSQVAKEVYEQLRTSGSVERGWLGVYFEKELTPELAKRFKVPEGRGVLVLEVFQGTPAAAAALQPGDVIVEFNQQTVNELGELQLMVAAAHIGSKVPLVVIRDGQRLNLEVTIGRRPSQAELRPKR